MLAFHALWEAALAPLRTFGLSTRRALLAGAVALAGCREGRAEAPADELIVVAGQSNALGYRLSDADLPPRSYEPDPRVQIWTGRGFATMEPGRNTGAPANPQCWGPEVAYARAWLADHPKGTLHVVKYARGSTGLAASADRDWAPESGELFAETTAAVRAARRALPQPAQVSAILWIQGEQDAAAPETAQAYAGNLARALPIMRLRWGDPETPVLVGRIAPTLRYAATVRAAQAAVVEADPLAASVDTADYPLLPDRLHFAAEGQLRLGAALYAARP